MKKLNIGCGYDKLPTEEGWINIDKAPQVKPDLIVDISQGLPFPDNSFDEIYSSHCLEHVFPDKFNFVLCEIGRVAKNGAILELDLPFDNIATRTNIDHYRTFNFSSFDQLCVGDDLRDYYYPFRLERIEAKPNKIYRVICTLFPWLIQNVHYKFRIKK
jgi:ubiquinone/menaquinone biosynthesis C-methylase UbiE